MNPTLKLTQRRFARRVDEISFSYTHGLVLSDQAEFGGIGLAVQRRDSPKFVKLTWYWIRPHAARRRVSKVRYSHC